MTYKSDDPVSNAMGTCWGGVPIEMVSTSRKASVIIGAIGQNFVSYTCHPGSRLDQYCRAYLPPFPVGLDAQDGPEVRFRVSCKDIAMLGDPLDETSKLRAFAEL